MATNRRKHTAPIKILPLAKSFVIVLFVALAGLLFVYLKNGLHPMGGQIKALERELSELSARNEVLKAKINSLSSRAVLQRRLDEGFVKMIPITDDRIVRVSAPPARIATNEAGSVGAGRFLK
jgi:hypothetical protein